MTHTPGPWEVHWVWRAADDEPTMLPPKQSPTGTITLSGWRASHEEWANARLIAAAPELLEALKALCYPRTYPDGYVTPVPHLAECHRYRDGREFCAPKCEQVRAAINKATGNAPDADCPGGVDCPHVVPHPTRAQRHA